MAWPFMYVRVGRPACVYSVQISIKRIIPRVCGTRTQSLRFDMFIIDCDKRACVRACVRAYRLCPPCRGTFSATSSPRTMRRHQLVQILILPRLSVGGCVEARSIHRSNTVQAGKTATKHHVYKQQHHKTSSSSRDTGSNSGLCDESIKCGFHEATTATTTTTTTTTTRSGPINQ